MSGQVGFKTFETSASLTDANVNWSVNLASQRKVETSPSDQEENTGRGASTTASKDINHSKFTTISLVDIETEATPALANTTLQNEILGVVSRLSKESVFINCHLPHDEVEVSFPINSIDEDIALYGTPVSITVEIVNGYKQPVIRERAAQPSVFTKDIEEIQNWIDTL